MNINKEKHSNKIKGNCDNESHVLYNPTFETSVYSLNTTLNAKSKHILLVKEDKFSWKRMRGLTLE